MKWKLFIGGLKAFILISYKNALQQQVLMLAMEGKYSRNWNEDECEFLETVKIKQASALGGIHKIVKILWKQDGPDKDVFSKQKSDKWLATYDYSKRQLTEVGGKRKCSFLPEKQLMFINDAKFEKIEWPKQDYSNLINRLV